MRRDRIMEDVWRAKDELARRFDYDLDKLCEHLRGPEESLPSLPKVRPHTTPVKRRKALASGRR